MRLRWRAPGPIRRIVVTTLVVATTLGTAPDAWAQETTPTPASTAPTAGTAPTPPPATTAPATTQQPAEKPAPSPVKPTPPTTKLTLHPGKPEAPTSVELPAKAAATNAQAADAPPPFEVDKIGHVDPGPDGSVDVPREPNKALQPIAPLPAVNPAPGSVAVDKAPLALRPPVQPEKFALPEHPAQELVDANAADALKTLRDAGRLNPDGTPNLDATQLQPQVSSAQFVDGRRATLQELIDALLSGNIPPPLPVDPLALLQQLPDGLPRLTYRICSESKTKQVSCSLTLPIGVPAVVDVTGDRTPDVLADLVPAAAVGDVVGAAREVLDLQRQINDATTRLNTILELLKDPINVILHPELLVEKLDLENLLKNLGDTLQQKVEALLNLVNVGLGLLSLRLPTSEYVGKDLPAHVWAVYDLPTHKRISLGFDGYRRGSSLPTATLGVYTFNPLKLLNGIYDIKASLLQVGAGDSMAITAGLASVTDDAQGNAYDPAVASARFSPVPGVFDAHALIDMGAPDRDQQATIDVHSTRQTQLDAQVLTNRRSTAPPADRFDQLKIDVLPTSVSAALTRPKEGAAATLQYRAASTIDNVLFADYTYSGATLNWAVQAAAKSVPASWDGVLKTPADKITFDYQASSSLAALDVGYFDRNPAIVGRGSLRTLPTKLNLLADHAASHVAFTADQPLGSAAVAFSKGLGTFAPFDGDHATLITRDGRIGLSAKVSGMKSVDAYYDGRPRLNTVFDPGGQSLVAGGDIDGVHKAHLEISNLPKTASLDLDTVARQVVYQASEVIHRVHGAYTNTTSGPSVLANVLELPQRVQVNYDLGDKPHVKYQASSRVSRLEFFASPGHVEVLRPEADHYLSTAVDDIPSTMDFLVDLPARHLEGNLSEQLGAITVVARFPLEGRDWTASAGLAGVPTKFDADFKEGSYRFRGLTGPLREAKLWVTNHAGAQAPTGLHVATHYRQTTGDLDASASVRNLTAVEYSQADGKQQFQLNLDTGGAPLFVDADLVLAANGVDDTRLAVLGRVDGLPSTVHVDFGGGKLVYSADRQVGLQAEVHAGKVAALAGLGAPLFANGAAAVGKTCADGAGCAKDSGPFCSTGKCLGAVATVNLPGLPTNVTVDLTAGTVAFTGYRPPSAPLQAYVRLIGVLDALPDFRALASLSGLPSPLDMTIGPFTVGSGSPVTFDAKYSASAPLGALQVDVDTTTTNAAFPVVRGRATVSKLPAAFHVNGAFGDRTTVGVHNSAVVGSLGLTVTGADRGYLSASGDSVPADADILADVPAKHIEGTMSSDLGGLSLLAHIPYQGREWSAYAAVRDVPSKFGVDFGNGTYSYHSDTPLGSAAFALTNHAGALAPTGQHLAVHYRESTSDLDASALLTKVSDVKFSGTKADFTAKFAAERQTLGLDADVVFAAGGADDLRVATLGRLGPLPSSITIGQRAGVLNYVADQPLDVQAQVWLGKVAALNGLGAPKFANGVSVVDALCTQGAGCARDDSPACLERGCVGLTGIVNVSGLPKTLTVDTPNRTYSFGSYQPKIDQVALYVDDRGAFVPGPLTRLKALVTLSGLPAEESLTVGPITMSDRFHVEYNATRGIGRLDAHAEADLRPKQDGKPHLENARALVTLVPVPRTVSVDGRIGDKSDLTVQNSDRLDHLGTGVTGEFTDGTEGSGAAILKQVPRKLNLTWEGFGDKKNTPGIPKFGYTALDTGVPEDLDSLNLAVGVEKALVLADSEDVKVGTGNLGLLITRLARSTTFAIAPDNTIQLKSEPVPTQKVHIIGNANIEVPMKDFSKDPAVFDCAGLIIGRLEGHLHVAPSRIERFDLVIDRLNDLSLAPGKRRFDLKAELGALPFKIIPLPGVAAVEPVFQAVDGDYGTLTVYFYGVDLHPDIDMQFRVYDTVIDKDRFVVKVKVTDPTNFVEARNYDWFHTSTIHLVVEPGGIPADLTVQPGLAAIALNAMVLHGGRPQMMNLIDLGAQIDGAIIDFLAAGVWPFNGEHTDPGEPPSCGS
ncbi:hypothetical protein [Amycolatopsis sp. NPDC051128]|uniref:hypothetical protein n=1 Tax=Amycolatopsis sp. NPDC051128 TaxID=3155412 RepID=UPI003433E71E